MICLLLMFKIFIKTIYLFLKLFYFFHLFVNLLAKLILQMLPSNLFSDVRFDSILELSLCMLS